MKDFIIDNGTLTGYTGSGGNIIIPDSVTSIGSWAFEGYKALTIHAPTGSYAEGYAKEKNIKFEAVSDG